MKAGIEELWDQFGNELRAFILSKVHDRSVADDILQDLFIKIHDKIDQLRDDTKVKSWIYQITRNLIIDYFREIDKLKRKSQNVFENIEEGASDNSVISEALSDMVNKMDDLPPEYCEALCMTEIEGMSQKAYAEKTGLTYTAAKSRVQRARKMLKDMLMKCCHYQFDKYGTVTAIFPANCCCCQS